MYNFYKEMSHSADKSYGMPEVSDASYRSCDISEIEDTLTRGSSQMHAPMPDTEQSGKPTP